MKNLINTIQEKLIINNNSKIKKRIIPSMENIIAYLTETYNLKLEIWKLWQQDEFYDSHYSDKLINSFDKPIIPQNYFRTKPVLRKEDVEALIEKLKNDEYNDGIIYVKELGELNGPNTNSVGLIYDYTLDKYFLNSIYNKS